MDFRQACVAGRLRPGQHWTSCPILFFPGWSTPRALLVRPPHRRFNNWQGDVKRTGAQAMRLETSLVMSSRKGPWSGASTYWKLHKTAQQYFDTFDHHEELFGLLYEDIVVDLNEGRVPGGRGTDVHMASTWEACKQSPFFIRKESRLREVDGSSGRTRLRSWRLGTPSSGWCCLCTA